jgi:hypothetical protein
MGIRGSIRGTRLAVLLAVTIAAPVRAQFVQQGAKLVGSGHVSLAGSPGVYQGRSVAVSADGNTVIVGGAGDSGGIGAAWVFTRAGGAWTQQGNKLVGTGADGLAGQGHSVALSGDGNTAIIGGPEDHNSSGAAWVFTRAGGAWTQQGGKLVGSDAVDAGGAYPNVLQGVSVALSADGNTALVGGTRDNGFIGAAWVFTRGNGVWTQQGSKLVGSGVATRSAQGRAAALSADGNTALVGGVLDGGYTGAVWVFTRANGAWSQQGGKLVGSGATGAAGQGSSVALSAAGDTFIEAGDIYDLGGVWVFTRSNGTWTQQGQRMIPAGGTGHPEFDAVSLSADGNTAIVGGYGDSDAAGAVWVLTRRNGVWTQQGTKLTGTGASGKAGQGGSVALSADGGTLIEGGQSDNGGIGAAWVFTQPVATHFQVSAPHSATAGTPSTFTVTALDANNNTAANYLGAVRFTSSDGAASLPLNATLSGGSGTFQAFLRTPGSQTITATDTVLPSLSGTSGAIAVDVPPPPAVAGTGPGWGSGSSQAMTFTFTDPRGWEDLDVVNVLINNFLDGRNSCYLAYSRPYNVLYLVNDPGTALLPGLVLNGGGSVSNSQCTVTGAGSAAAGSGNTLTLTLNLSFGAGFAGNKVTYLAARDPGGGNSGWQALGTWNVPGSTTVPAVGGVTPARGAGPNQTYTFTFSDNKGAQDIGVVNILVNNFLDGRQACYIAYSQPNRVLYLVGDAGGGLSPGLTLGGSGTASNSQCTVHASGSSATVGGNTLTLALNVSFAAGFAGNRVIYMAARDSAETNNSGWQAMGTWTVE